MNFGQEWIFLLLHTNLYIKMKLKANSVSTLTDAKKLEIKTDNFYSWTKDHLYKSSLHLQTNNVFCNFQLISPLNLIFDPFRLQYHKKIPPYPGIKVICRLWLPRTNTDVHFHKSPNNAWMIIDLGKMSINCQLMDLT